MSWANAIFKVLLDWLLILGLEVLVSHLDGTRSIKQSIIAFCKEPAGRIVCAPGKGRVLRPQYTPVPILSKSAYRRIRSAMENHGMYSDEAIDALFGPFESTPTSTGAPTPTSPVVTSPIPLYPAWMVSSNPFIKGFVESILVLAIVLLFCWVVNLIIRIVKTFNASLNADRKGGNSSNLVKPHTPTNGAAQDQAPLLKELSGAIRAIQTRLSEMESANGTDSKEVDTLLPDLVSAMQTLEDKVSQYESNSSSIAKGHGELLAELVKSQTATGATSKQEGVLLAKLGETIQALQTRQSESDEAKNAAFTEHGDQLERLARAIKSLDQQLQQVDSNKNAASGERAKQAQEFSKAIKALEIKMSQAETGKETTSLQLEEISKAVKALEKKQTQVDWAEDAEAKEESKKLDEMAKAIKALEKQQAQSESTVGKASTEQESKVEELSKVLKALEKQQFESETASIRRESQFEELSRAIKALEKKQSLSVPQNPFRPSGTFPSATPWSMYPPPTQQLTPDVTPLPSLFSRPAPPPAPEATASTLPSKLPASAILSFSQQAPLQSPLSSSPSSSTTAPVAPKTQISAPPPSSAASSTPSPAPKSPSVDPPSPPPAPAPALASPTTLPAPKSPFVAPQSSSPPPPPSSTPASPQPLEARISSLISSIPAPAAPKSALPAAPPSPSPAPAAPLSSPEAPPPNTQSPPPALSRSSTVVHQQPRPLETRISFPSRANQTRKQQMGNKNGRGKKRGPRPGPSQAADESYERFQEELARKKKAEAEASMTEMEEEADPPVSSPPPASSTPPSAPEATLPAPPPPPPASSIPIPTSKAPTDAVKEARQGKKREPRPSEEANAGFDRLVERLPPSETKEKGEKAAREAKGDYGPSKSSQDKKPEQQPRLSGSSSATNESFDRLKANLAKPKEEEVKETTTEVREDVGPSTSQQGKKKQEPRQRSGLAQEHDDSFRRLLDRLPPGETKEKGEKAAKEAKETTAPPRSSSYQGKKPEPRPRQSGPSSATTESFARLQANLAKSKKEEQQAEQTTTKEVKEDNKPPSQSYQGKKPEPRPGTSGPSSGPSSTTNESFARLQANLAKPKKEEQAEQTTTTKEAKDDANPPPRSSQGKKQEPPPQSSGLAQGHDAAFTRLVDRLAPGELKEKGEKAAKEAEETRGGRLTSSSSSYQGQKKKQGGSLPQLQASRSESGSAQQETNESFDRMMAGLRKMKEGKGEKIEEDEDEEL